MKKSRRQILVSAAATMAMTNLPIKGEASADPLLPLWRAWTSIHLSRDGRVVDAFQQHGSHSEGQGYAMLIATAVGDHETFKRLYDWSETHLAVRPDDRLFAWRWLPGGADVTDMNNASDGDLFIAWALLRASRRFGVADYAERASEIANELLRVCVKQDPRSPDQFLLLPGVDGFDTRGGYIINPAYYMPQAMYDLSDHAELPDLRRCAVDGVALLSTLARDGLVPDWCSVTSSGVGPAPLKSEDFGYEAMRVPLYMIWSRMPGHAAVRMAARAYRQSNVSNGNRSVTVIGANTLNPKEFSTDPGYRALSALAACSTRGYRRDMMPPFDPRQSYYPATLHMFALIAQREARIDCSI